MLPIDKYPQLKTPKLIDIIHQKKENEEAKLSSNNFWRRFLWDLINMERPNM